VYKRMHSSCPLYETGVRSTKHTELEEDNWEGHDPNSLKSATGQRKDVYVTSSVYKCYFIPFYKHVSVERIGIQSQKYVKCRAQSVTERRGAG